MVHWVWYPVAGLGGIFVSVCVICTCLYIKDRRRDKIEDRISDETKNAVDMKDVMVNV